LLYQASTQYHQSKNLSGNEHLISSGVESIANPYDMVALGVDAGILLSDRAFAGADTLATGFTLTRAIEQIGQKNSCGSGSLRKTGDRWGHRFLQRCTPHINRLPVSMGPSVTMIDLKGNQSHYFDLH
jgi:hypothetical protein